MEFERVKDILLNQLNFTKEDVDRISFFHDELLNYNRKYKAKEKATFYNFSNMDRNIYLYNNSRFIKLSYDNKINDEILKNNLKCRI